MGIPFRLGASIYMKSADVVAAAHISLSIKFLLNGVALLDLLQVLEILIHVWTVHEGRVVFSVSVYRG